MTDWYYHDAAQGRVGPLTADELRARYRERRIARDTLVWHAGLHEWQPLDRVAEELGLDSVAPDASQPPPLPPHSATARPMYADARPRSTPPPKKRMHGCLIALIVVAALSIPLIGILAAIALPAYQDYTLRAKVSESFAAASQVKLLVVEHMTANDGACPTDADIDVAALSSGTIAAIELGTLTNGHCAFEMQLRGIGPTVDGQTLLFEVVRTDPFPEWDCSGGTVAAKHRPRQCRAQP